MTGAVLMSAQHEVCTSKDVHLHLSHVAIVLLASWLREAYPGCCKLEAVARHYSLTASYSLIHEGFLDVVFCSTSECVPESPINSSQQWVHIRSSAQGLNLKSTQPRACVRVPDEPKGPARAFQSPVRRLKVSLLELTPYHYLAVSPMRHRECSATEVWRRSADGLLSGLCLRLNRPTPSILTWPGLVCQLGTPDSGSACRCSPPLCSTIARGGAISKFN